MSQQTSRVAEQTERAVSVPIGNAFAYFVVLYYVQQGHLAEQNIGEAVAFGGAIISYALLQLRTAIKWVARLIETRLLKD